MFKTNPEMSNTYEQEVEKDDFKVVIDDNILELCLADEAMINEAEEDNLSDNEIAEEKEEMKLTKGKKHSYHNCQKHLVNTLRKVINPKLFGVNQNTAQIEIKLWQLFKGSKRKTKDLISLTFGNGEVYYLEKHIIYYGFQSIYGKYSKELITNAKFFLQKEIIRQIHEKGIESIVEGTKIENKQYFLHYMKEFLNSLQHNNFEERFTPLKKKTE